MPFRRARPAWTRAPRGCGGMVDAPDSKSGFARSVGSSPTTPTSALFGLRFRPVSVGLCRILTTPCPCGISFGRIKASPDGAAGRPVSCPRDRLSAPTGLARSAIHAQISADRFPAPREAGFAHRRMAGDLAAGRRHAQSEAKAVKALRMRLALLLAGWSFGCGGTIRRWMRGKRAPGCSWMRARCCPGPAMTTLIAASTATCRLGRRSGRDGPECASDLAHQSGAISRPPGLQASGETQRDLFSGMGTSME